MKVKNKKVYVCELCGREYDSSAAAKKCESRPISGDLGARIGDKVMIIRGEGKGKATVTGRWIYDREWGHYAWKRYWHTVGLSADLEDKTGSRQLTFDDYEVIRP